VNPEVHSVPAGPAGPAGSWPHANAPAPSCACRLAPPVGTLGRVRHAQAREAGGGRGG